jgi:hypothetical protein
VSLGQQVPIVPNDSEVGRSRNRWIEIRLLPILDANVAEKPDAGAPVPASTPPAPE